MISLCEPAEYYIRPTPLTTNTSCPGQPCFTLNQYMNNTSHYVQSNTVLNFLPGKHVLERPLHIINVENVTLKSSTAGSGMFSQLHVRFSCENESLNHCIYTQSAIEMINVTNVVINDISLVLWISNVSGVTVEQSTNVHVQLDIHYVKGNDSHAKEIAANETTYLKLQGDNLHNGIRIENTNKVSIINSSFDNCQNSGMVIINSDAIDISNTTLSDNMENGMYLESCSNTILTSISATNNQKDGIELISCNSVSLKDISVINNTQCGMNLSLCINTDLKNINATNNHYNGLVMSQCKHVRMMVMYLEKNQVIGLVLIFSSHMRLTNISSINNSRGMLISECENTTMMSILSAINNQDDGMYFDLCKNTTMMNIYAISNQDNGMYFDSCENTAMMNISTINNQDDGVQFESCENTTLMNIYAINNKDDGVQFESCENTTLMNIYAINNKDDGVILKSCRSTTLMSISAISNQDDGMYFDSCENTAMMNIFTINNQDDGVQFESCENTTMMNISVISNQDNGMYFDSCENTTMMNISTIKNANGVKFESCENTTIVNISSINNKDDGVKFESCENTTMINISVISNQDNGMYFDSCENTAMMNISTINNQANGVKFESCEDTKIMNISSKNNKDDGVKFESCENTRMINISAISNIDNGMKFELCKNITMMNMSTINNQNDGLDFESCENTILMSISAINNQDDGLAFASCKNTTLMSISAINNQKDGLHFESCENTTLMNISTINNKYDGIYIDDCENTTMVNISTIYNQYSGILVHACENATMINVSAIKNQNEGIDMVNCTNTILIDVNAAYNRNVGIVIENHFQNIVLRNMSANHNGNVQITFLSSDNIQLEYSTFSDITALPTLNIATKPHTVPAVIELNNSTLIMVNCIFTRNNITSIRAIRSKIIAERKIIFSDNHALSGAALLFISSSVLVISETSSVHFQNNHAVNYGGAIYILTDEYYTKSVSIQDILFQYMNKFYRNSASLVTPRTRCFLSVEGNRSQARLVFTNNTAGKGGDVAYGGLMAMGYDGDWNCLLSFKNISDMSEQNGLSVISSEPSRVCLCHNGQPDCLTVADPITHSVYPGQTITLPAVVVGQDFGTVTGSVIPQFLQDYTTCPIQLEQGQKSTYVNNGQCADLKYTLYTSGGENCTAILTLKTSNAEVLQPMNTDDNHKLNKTWTVLNKEPNYHELSIYLINKTMKRDEIRDDLFHIISSNFSEVFINNFLKFSVDSKYIFIFPDEIYSYPIFINISFQSCPLGFALSGSPLFKCDCNHLLQQMPQVTCDIQHQTITRNGLVWVGTYGNNTVAASKYCPYNYCKSMRVKITLTLQESDSDYDNHSTIDFQCNQHHSGVLCGGCQPGLSLALGTNRCLPCSNAYISLLLPFAMAGLLLVVFIKLLNLTISQGTMNELIFYVNVVSANKHLYYSQTSINPMTLFIAWLNLDIGIETCFFNGLTAYTRTWLQFVFPLYIWVIAGAIIFIAKYSDRVAKVMGNNGVPVLATLFLLSYAKLFNTIITAMSYTTLYTTQGRKLVWSADGNVDYLGPKHIPLFGVAVAALIFLCLPYTLLLLLGQWLHRLNCHFITRMLLNLKPFLDAHFAALKGKHRYWFGLLLIARAANLLISASIPDSTTGVVEFSTAILSILLTFWGQKVYRSSAVGTFGTAFLLNLAIMNLTRLFSIIISDGNISIVSFTLIAMALAQFLGLVLYKVVVIVKCSQRMTACCAREKKPNNDWELYEQAALEREQAARERQMKSETEVDRENEMTGSIKSVPTYGI